MTIGYNLNIPDGPHNPSNDQPLMKANTNAIAQIIAVDHVGFGVGNGGFHQQVRMPVESLPTVAAGFGGLYVNTASSATPLTESDLFYTPDASTNIYQLTRTITGSYTLFSTNTTYQALSSPQPAVTGGWTFLPGGMLFQYGLATNANLNLNNVINFPVPFNTFVGSITVTGVRSNTNDKVVGILNGSVTLTQFLLELSSSDRPNAVYWMAIGV